MQALYTLCDGSGSCLCSPWELLRRFPADRRPDEAQTEKILRDLQSDGYINLILSERKGERMYVITLRAGGIGFLREEQQLKRSILWKTFLTITGAVASFLVGLLLKVLFS